jgi:20S proteasome alpha/beta subunit
MVGFSVVCWSLLALLVVTARSAGSAALNDLSMHKYTDNGEVAQLAYAARAVSRSSPRLCFKDEQTGCILLFAFNKAASDLSSRFSSGIEFAPEANTVLLPVGYGPDSRYLLTQVNMVVQNHCLVYGEGPNLHYLAMQISRWVTRGMYRGGEDPIARPLASAVVLAAVDSGGSEAVNRLLQVDNTGAVTERRVSMMGALSAVLQEKILRILREPTDVLPTVTGTSSAREGRLLLRVEECLALLMEERDDVVECAILKSSGSISRSPVLRSDQAVAWIKAAVET